MVDGAQAKLYPGGRARVPQTRSVFIFLPEDQEGGMVDINRKAWRSWKRRRDKARERRKHSQTDSQSMRMAVLLSAILFGGIGGLMGTYITEDGISQFLCWLLGICAGVGFAWLVSYLLRSKAAK